jgi:hypothetical protein
VFSFVFVQFPTQYANDVAMMCQLCVPVMLFIWQLFLKGNCAFSFIFQPFRTGCASGCSYYELCMFGSLIAVVIPYWLCATRCLINKLKVCKPPLEVNFLSRRVAEQV